MPERPGPPQELIMPPGVVKPNGNGTAEQKPVEIWTPPGAVKPNGKTEPVMIEVHEEGEPPAALQPEAASQPPAVETPPATPPLEQTMYDGRAPEQDAQPAGQEATPTSQPPTPSDQPLPPRGFTGPLNFPKEAQMSEPVPPNLVNRKGEPIPQPPAPPAPETPENVTPEQPASVEEINERIEIARQIVVELAEREEKRQNERYGRGFMGKARRWFNTTKIGRAVHIGGKIVLGTAAAITAGVIAGNAGLLLAPALYALGSKEAIDGAIEAVQYMAKGRGARLKLEGKKQELFIQEEAKLGNLLLQLRNGEISAEQYDQQVANLVLEIKNAEEAVIQTENENIGMERRHKVIRTVLSSTAAIALGLLNGVVLGTQNFDGQGASHVVRWSARGFQYIKDIGSNLAHIAGFGAGGPLMLAPKYMAAAPYVGKMAVGLGAAAIGLVAATVAQLRAARRSREIVSEDPKFLQLSPQTSPEVPEAEEAASPEGTDDAAAPNLTAEADGTAGQPGEQAPAGETPPITPPVPSFTERVGNVEATLDQQRARLDEIDNELRALDEEYYQLDRKDMKGIGDQERMKEIEETHAALTAEKQQIMETLKSSDVAYIRERNAIDDQLRGLEEEWNQLENAPIKTAETRARQQEIEQLCAELDEKKRNLRQAAETREQKKVIGSVAEATTFDELDAYLDTIEGIQGSDGHLYRSADLKKFIGYVRNGELDISYITRSEGLRDKVIELLAKPAAEVVEEDEEEETGGEDAPEVEAPERVPFQNGDTVAARNPKTGRVEKKWNFRFENPQNPGHFFLDQRLPVLDKEGNPIPGRTEPVAIQIPLAELLALNSRV